MEGCFPVARRRSRPSRSSWIAVIITNVFQEPSFPLAFSSSNEIIDLLVLKFAEMAYILQQKDYSNGAMITAGSRCEHLNFINVSY